MISEKKTSFIVLLSLVFLLPVFFVPGGSLESFDAKSMLLAIALPIAVVFLAYELWKSKSLSVPNHGILYPAITLPIVYLLSSLLATPSSLSLFGYNFEIGTFGQIMIGSSLFFIALFSVNETKKTLRLISALYASLFVVTLFSLVKILSGGEWLILGNFPSVTGNPVGAWSDISVSISLLSILSIIAINMLSMTKALRYFAYFVFGLTVFLSTIFNFTGNLVVSLLVAVLLVIYFARIETNFVTSQSNNLKKTFIPKNAVLPIILTLFTLALLVNPLISKDKRLNDVISNTFGINNSEIRPTFASTLNISKAALSQEALLGSGPNTFSRDWLIYRPASINATPFWGVTFPLGAGFIPTQVAATGILGTLIWIVFFLALISLGVRFILNIPDSRADRFALLSSFVASLFLWGNAFFYGPSLALLTLAFIVTGVFVITCVNTGLVGERIFNFADTSVRVYVYPLAFLVVAGIVFVGWEGVQRGMASYHFKKAVNISNTEGSTLNDVENRIQKAISFSPVDVYFNALSRINFAKAQIAANSATGTPESNKEIFEDGIAKSIDAARSALNVNSAGFENWVALGSIYSSLVPEPLKIEGAYENALFAFSEASRRNPNNPQLPLLFAELELNKGDFDKARSYVRSSIALKQDFAEAYIFLARLEVNAKNLPGAIESAETLAKLSPDNPGVYFELGMLKYSNNDFARALEDFEKSLSILPDYANAKYYLGLTKRELGDKEGAKKHFEELLITNPENEELLKAIESLETKPSTNKR